MIPYGRQDVTQDDINAVIAVLRSDFLTQGPTIPAFERAVAARCGAAHALAVNSATAALHVACLALDIGPGDYVWTSPVSFVASANCARYCGATVDFVDIDPETFNLCPKALARKLEQAQRAGTLPKVVIAVHMAGQSCDMVAIRKLADIYKFRIFEDASHAIGGSYLSQPVGSCKYSDITVFSFHPVKIVTTGEGGMALTNDPALAEKMMLFRSHGITRDAAQLLKKDEGGWYYEQQALGFNYRMTDMQAALGLSQLSRIDHYIEARHRLADRYDHQLAALPLRLPARLADRRSALHLYIVRLDPAGTSKTRRAVFDELRSAGIGVNVHYIPIHLQPDYLKLGFKAGDFPEAEAYYQNCISLPMFATLSSEMQDEVIGALHKIMGP